jgi:hypothetical protein
MTKEKVQKNKQWSTKHYIKNERQNNMTPLKTGGMNLGVPEGIAFPAPHMAPIVKQTTSNKNSLK